MADFLVVGTGYVGFAAAQGWKQKGASVLGLCQSTETHHRLIRSHIEPFVADLTQQDALKHLPPSRRVLVCAAPLERNKASYRQLYVEGLGRLWNQLRRWTDLEKVIYLSSTGVWGDLAGERVDDSTPVKAESERQSVLMETEEMFARADLPSLILRLGGIYGPDRNRLESLREGLWPDVEQDRYLNLIHREDVVGIVDWAFQQTHLPPILIGVDEKPVRMSEMACWLAQKMNLNRSFLFKKGSFAAGKQCLSQKLRSLGYRFVFPTFQQGYETLLNTPAK